MHETERHRIILSAVQDKPVVTVGELRGLTGASEATIRRDIASLHMKKKLRRVRGGAEAITPPQFVGLAGRPFAVNEARHSLLIFKLMQCSLSHWDSPFVIISDIIHR